jgi:tetratricopeptide (TPR) repeat protein
MAINRTITAARTMRKNSFSGLTLGMDLGQLGRFLQQTIPRFASDRDLEMSAVTEYHALTARIKREVRLENCRDELVNCMTVLSAFLSSASELPGTVIFEAHSLIGCIQETLRQHKLASLSFMKALWIASSTDEVTTELLGVTLHRLGRAYYSMGTYNEAKGLIEKALLQYDAAKVHRDHAVVVEAREWLHMYEKHMMQAAALAARTNQRWASFSGRGYQQRRLSLIREETSERRTSLS